MWLIDGWNPANQLIDSLTHDLQFFCIPGGAEFLPSTLVLWRFYQKFRPPRLTSATQFSKVSRVCFNNFVCLTSQTFEVLGYRVITLPETKSLPLKMDGWSTTVSFWGPAHFQVRTVSFREFFRSTCFKKTVVFHTFKEVEVFSQAVRICCEKKGRHLRGGGVSQVHNFRVVTLYVECCWCDFDDQKGAFQKIWNLKIWNLTPLVCLNP